MRHAIILAGGSGARFLAVESGGFNQTIVATRRISEKADEVFRWK